MHRVTSWIKRHPIALVSATLLIVILTIAANYADRAPQQLSIGLKSSGSAAGAPGGYGMGRDALGIAEESADMAVSTAPSFMPSPVPPMEPTAGETAAEVEQRIIKTGTLRMVVGDVLAAIEEITTQASSIGGFVENSSMSEDRGGQKTGWITVRVPVDQFDGAVSRIRSLADLVREESVQGQDVTEQYTDLQARLRNAKEQEEAYLSILDQASSVEDILKVQRELGNIRAQIESYEGRLKYLENRTSFSTISVYLETEADVQLPTKEFKFSVIVKEAVQALVIAFQGLLTAVVWIVIVGLSLGLTAGLVLWLLYLVIRRFRRSKR